MHISITPATNADAHELLSPSLYQINTRVWLTELSGKLGQSATLGDRTDDANFAWHQSQCYVRLPFSDLTVGTVQFMSQMGPASYDRDGDDLVTGGLYRDVPPWSAHVFEVTPL